VTPRAVPRRAALGLAAGGLALPLRPARGQERPFRIYMITFRGWTDVERGFQDYLATRKVPFELILRDAGRDPARVAGFVREIKTIRPDLVYTWGTPVTLAVVGPYDAVNPERHVTDIPVVFTLVAAPVRAKVVPALASSGRLVTGAYHVVPTDAQLRAIQSYRPFDTLGVLYTPSEPNSVAVVEEIAGLAQPMGFRLVQRQFRTDGKGKPTRDGVAGLIAEIKAEGADWLYLLPDTFLGTIYDLVTPQALSLGLPSFGAAELAIREGGALAGLVCRYYSVGQLTAAKAEQILVQKADPATIPVETLKRFSLIINIGVARALELYPPLAMLNYAEVLRE
jgi:putative ABC transport system substrate-binding protein